MSFWNSPTPVQQTERPFWESVIQPSNERKTPETTGTSDSYNTAPVEPEPIEQPPTTQKEEETQEPMAASSSDADMEPVIQPSGERTNELKLNQPKPFTGKREDFDSFMQDVVLYLSINERTYDTGGRKIAFVLSFMNEGDAKSWKTQYIRAHMNDAGVIALGTWPDFRQLLIEAFSPYDAPGDALDELTNLKMGNNAIEDHISKFKILRQQSGVAEDSPSAIDYFRRTLNIPLQRKLLELPTPPKNLKEWYEWATKLDNNYRKMQRILG